EVVCWQSGEGQRGGESPGHGSRDGLCSLLHSPDVQRGDSRGKIRQPHGLHPLGWLGSWFSAQVLHHRRRPLCAEGLSPPTLHHAAGHRDIDGACPCLQRWALLRGLRAEPLPVYLIRRQAKSARDYWPQR
ncbi:unnamed protein product, partial [Symbiodinium natans]